jgi:hypothetical protein
MPDSWNASIAPTCVTTDRFAAATSAACCAGSACAARQRSTVHPAGR